MEMPGSASTTFSAAASDCSGPSAAQTAPLIASAAAPIRSSVGSASAMGLPLASDMHHAYYCAMTTPLILHVETNLGLRPSGVERLGAVLLDLGLAERVGGKFAGHLRAPQFDHWRDPEFGARNVRAAAAL